jgi:hypothetical protein
MRSFRKIPWMEEKIQRTRYFVLPVKCPSLEIDCNRNWKCCGPWWVNARYGISRKSLEWMKRYSQSTLFFKYSALHYRSVATKLQSAECCGSAVRYVVYQRSPWNGRYRRKDTLPARKKVLLMTNGNQTYAVCSTFLWCF